MKMWKRYCAGLVAAAGLTAGLRAQPGVPAVPPPPGAPAVPAAPPATLWTFLGIGKEQRAACKAQFCQSQIGQLMNNGMKPIGALSGGLMPSCCPPVNAADLLKPPDSSEGAAARIKADEAGAAARIEAVRYLATVDCNRWPEAKGGLITALRQDRNECVRFEGAKALGSGCCCSKETLEALSIAVSGSTRDGNPMETSERVRDTARASLENCLTRLGAAPLPLEPAEIKKETPEKPREGVLPPKVETPGSAGADYYHKTVSSLSAAEVVQNARKAVVRPKPMNGAVAMRASRGDAGVVGIIVGAFNPAPAATAPQPAAIAETETPRAPASEIKPVAYLEPAPVAPVVQPMPQVSASRPVVDPTGLMVTLARASYPEDRIWAAQGLAGIDGRMNPAAIDALMTAARKDSTAAVRAECVRTLTTTGVGLVKLDELFQELHNDPDQRVREAVDQARKQYSPRGTTTN